MLLLLGSPLSSLRSHRNSSASVATTGQAWVAREHERHAIRDIQRAFHQEIMLICSMKLRDMHLALINPSSWIVGVSSTKSRTERGHFQQSKGDGRYIITQHLKWYCSDWLSSSARSKEPKQNSAQIVIITTSSRKLHLGIARMTKARSICLPCRVHHRPWTQLDPFSDRINRLVTRFTVLDIVLMW
jgi:hypothetical protein